LTEVAISGAHLRYRDCGPGSPSLFRERPWKPCKARQPRCHTNFGPFKPTIVNRFIFSFHLSLKKLRFSIGRSGTAVCIHSALRTARTSQNLANAEDVWFQDEMRSGQRAHRLRPRRAREHGLASCGSSSRSGLMCSVPYARNAMLQSGSCCHLQTPRRWCLTSKQSVKRCDQADMRCWC
jgi:hypothetical protein